MNKLTFVPKTSVSKVDNPIADFDHVENAYCQTKIVHYAIRVFFVQLFKDCLVGGYAECSR